MKILHTADWHLNDHTHTNRQPDISTRLEEIAGYLKDNQVDVMVVAGDLFSRYNRMEDIRDAISDVNRIFRPFLLSDGTILVISGNHDSEALFNMLRLALDMVHPVDPHIDVPRPPGRLYLAAQPAYLRLADKRGHQVQFALLPYPTLSRYLQGEQTRFASIDEKNRSLQTALRRKVEELKNRYIDPALPSVLVSHLHVRGTAVHNLYQISEREDVVFEPGDIPAHWAYAAYGHIHKPQCIAGMAHARYAGSVERMDFSEQEAKSVVLLEIEDGQRAVEPVELRLDATPLYRIEINDPPNQLPGLRDRYPEPDRAIVSYTMRYVPGEHNPDAISAEIEAAFPRWCHREIIPIGFETTPEPGGWKEQGADFTATVMDYLRETMAGRPEQDELLGLANKLLAEMESGQ